jgi:hypothetical protein
VTSDLVDSPYARGSARAGQGEFPSHEERLQALASVSQRSLPSFTAGVRSRAGSQASSRRSRAASVSVGSFAHNQAAVRRPSVGGERTRSFGSQSKDSDQQRSVHARRPSTVAREPSAFRVGSARDVGVSDEASSVAGYTDEVDKMTKVRANAESLVVATRTLFGLTPEGQKTQTALGGLLSALTRWKEAAIEFKSESYSANRLPKLAYNC